MARVATAAYGRSSMLLYALHNVGGPDGYRYYGSKVFTRRRLSSASAAQLSLAALADSLLPLILTALGQLTFCYLPGEWGSVLLERGLLNALGTWVVASSTAG